MYKSFKVQNFRCFRKLIIDGLERVNLITGVNNVGKTALLEAMFLHCGAYNPALALNLSAFRGIEALKIKLGESVEPLWDSLFHQFDTSKNIVLAGENTTTAHRSLRLNVIHKPLELSKIAKFSKSPDISKGVLSSSLIAKVLKLEYKEGNRKGSFYMILDRKGIHIDPVPPSPPFPAFFQGARMRSPFPDEAERFGNLEIHGKQNILLEVLHLIESRLSRLSMVVVAGEPILHGDIGMGRLIPLPVMGEGMVRLASLVLFIGNAPGGVILVDEIENGLHHSILPKVWRAIGAMARKFNTQVFATTHSWECVVAAHRAFTDGKVYDFRLHRLERTKKTIHAVTYDQKTLESAIEMNLEIR